LFSEYAFAYQFEYIYGLDVVDEDTLLVVVANKEAGNYRICLIKLAYYNRMRMAWFAEENGCFSRVSELFDGRFIVAASTGYARCCL
jgi:hypothetical protein